MTPQQKKDYIDAQFPDNPDGQITEAVLREGLKEIVIEQTRKYAVLKGRITQNSTNAPTMQISENELGFVPVFSYDAVGKFKLIDPGSSGIMTLTKTNFFGATPYREGHIQSFAQKWADANTILLFTHEDGGLANGVLNNTYFELQVLTL